MSMQVQTLSDEWIPATKVLIAEVVLEFYGDIEWLPKTLPGLLEHYEKVGYLKDLDDYKAHFGTENGIFLILTEGKQVVGCGGLRRLTSGQDKGKVAGPPRSRKALDDSEVHNQGELVRLWLRHSYRKQGLGRKLLDALLRKADELGYAHVFLDTSNRCSDALRLFRRNGFIDCAPYKESLGDVFLVRHQARLGLDKTLPPLA